VCFEPGCQLNTVGVTTGFPSTVTSSAPCGNASTVIVTFGLVLVVDIVVEITDVVVVFVVLWGEWNQARNGLLAAAPCEVAGCVGLLSPGELDESKKTTMINGVTDTRNFKLILTVADYYSK